MGSQWKTNKHGSAGYLLLDSVIAVAVLGIGVVGFSTLLASLVQVKAAEQEQQRQQQEQQHRLKLEQQLLQQKLFLSHF